MIDQFSLRKRLSYNPETGLWTWVWCPPPNQRRTGTVAGNTRSDGYVLLRLDGVLYYSHRLAWFYMTGQWPTQEIDHVDRDPNNNCWSNLREASSSDNKCNSQMNSRNSSGFRGVGWMPQVGKWQVHVNGMYCGRFDDLEEAIAFRDSFAQELQGNFVSLNTRKAL